MNMNTQRKVPDELKTLKRRGKTLRESRGNIEFLIIMIDVTKCNYQRDELPKRQLSLNISNHKKGRK